jgi:HEPN domain-containing protein
MRRSLSDPEIEAYISKAERDLATAQHMAEEGATFADVICFHAEQCAEKALKALLLRLDQVPPRTHDLVWILQTIIAIEPDMAAVEYECMILTDYAVAPRYPGWEDVTGAVDLPEVIKSAAMILKRVMIKLGLNPTE